MKGGYMQHITGYFRRFFKYLIVNFLYAFVEIILSFDIGKPDSIAKSVSCKVINNCKKYREYPDPSLKPDLPKAISIKTPNYIELLKTAEKNKEPIIPVKHRKPIDKNLTCPYCSAPYLYIYSNATVKVKHRKRRIQKYRCKICFHQWFPNSTKRNLIFYCPFCRIRLNYKRTRREFDIYICKNDNCEYFKKNNQRYIYRDYFFDVHKLQLATPEKSLVNLSNSKFSQNVMAMAFVLHINYRINYRRTADFLKNIFNINISYTTIYNWCESLAYLLAPIVTKLPISSSNLLVIDETYEKYAGYWGYYYACLDAINRYLIAPHFSPKRNVKAAATTIMGAINRISNKYKQIFLVHDYFPTYFLAVQLINQASNEFKIISLPVKGLKDKPYELNPFRKYKNIIERYFGTQKPIYAMARGFGSIKGAISHNILHAIDYNYFHPHELYRYNPPIEIPGLKSNHPIEKWNKLIQLAMSLN